MKVIEPSYEILTPINGEEILKQIERAGRVAYKSEDRIYEGSAEKFVKMICDRKHFAVIEMFDITVKLTVDRGVSHEAVRHRLCSFVQSSTRYCNYSKGKFGGEITVIKPCFFEECEGGKPKGVMNFDRANYTPSEEMTAYDLWYYSCKAAEKAYLLLIEKGKSPQEARSVLPNSLMTEIVIKANLREWRTILELRTSKAAHPQMIEVMRPLCKELQSKIPIVFDDIMWEE